VLAGPEEAIGSLRISFRRPGTPDAAQHTAFLDSSGSILADARRQGAGTLMLREVLHQMHLMDRTILTLSAHSVSGQAFLTHVGAVAKHSSVENRAILAHLDWARLREWEDSAEDVGLVWERHAGRVPRERLVELLPVFTTLFADMPLGALEMPPIRSEISGYDHWYDIMDQVGGAHHLILLRASDGEVVGLSEAGWDSRFPNMAYQHLTAVARPWRGRGLARALKAGTMRHIRSHHPELKMMITSNAESNAPMLSINARVGFIVYRRTVDYQITRGALDAWSLAPPHQESDACE
jgi:GNAT superfamily N-acetyltransferase